MRKGIPHFFIYWLPLIIWVAVIFILSAQPGGNLIKLSLWQTFLRKGFHVFEFSLLAFLLWRLFYCGYKVSFRRSFWAALFLVILFSVSDEFHQNFVLNRNGNQWDVLLDSLAAFFILQCLRFFWAKRKIIPLAIILITFSSLISLMGWMIIQTWELKKIHGDFLLRNSSEEKAINITSNEEKEERKISKDNVNNETELHNHEKDRIADDSLDLKPEDSADKTNKSETLEHSTESVSDAENLPSKVLITVPFTSQAPFGKWDNTHEEACEEASLLMVRYFLEGRKELIIGKQEAENELQKMKNFQVKEYGKFEDSTMEEIVMLAQDFYQIKKLTVVYDFEVEDLKKELAKGFPVIVPTAGRKLDNPYYTSPGPLYHNLVLIGYEDSKVITNDPGTKRGQGFKYDLQKLYSAIHDFPGDKNKIIQGRKAMIVIKE